MLVKGVVIDKLQAQNQYIYHVVNFGTCRAAA